MNASSARQWSWWPRIPDAAGVQVVVGGREKFMINAKQVQQACVSACHMQGCACLAGFVESPHTPEPRRKRALWRDKQSRTCRKIQDLFQSVSLNVNNPHFLIMQGRITKVLNMKPPEILGMVEEAANTRMCDQKCSAARKTLSKKEGKRAQIDEVRPRAQTRCGNASFAAQWGRQPIRWLACQRCTECRCLSTTCGRVTSGWRARRSSTSTGRRRARAWSSWDTSCRRTAAGRSCAPSRARTRPSRRTRRRFRASTPTRRASRCVGIAGKPRLFVLVGAPPGCSGGARARVQKDIKAKEEELERLREAEGGAAAARLQAVKREADKLGLALAKHAGIVDGKRDDAQVRRARRRCVLLFLVRLRGPAPEAGAWCRRLRKRWRSSKQTWGR